MGKDKGMESAGTPLLLPLWCLGRYSLQTFLKFPVGRRLTLAVARRQVPEMWHYMGIELWNVCNLRCKMCPYPQMTRRKERMPMELYKRIIDDAAESGIQYVSLSVTNEPLLDERLPKAIRYAKSKGLPVGLTSNGTLATPAKMAEILETGIDRIIFSFDGATKETYETIRVGADFETTRDNIVQVIQERNRRGLARPAIAINYVVQEDNKHEVEMFRGSWRGIADEVNTFGMQDQKGVGVRFEELSYKHAYPCPRLLVDWLVVLPDGKCALCCNDYDGRFILGDLTKQSIRDVRNSPAFKEVAELFLSGRGDEIPLCRETKCDGIYSSAAFWWERQLAASFHMPRLAREVGAPV